MRKLKIALIGLFFLFFVLNIPISPQSYHEHENFLVSATSVNAGATAVNGTNFTSRNVRVSRLGYGSVAAITVTFTRSAGSSSTVDFEFQVSFDNGTTWSTAYYVRIQVATNETAASNVVRKTTEINFYGISHVRLYRIVNNDGANNLTACNATLSI